MTEEIKEILDNQKLINVENDYERIIFEYLANNCSEFDDEHIKQLVNLKVEQYKQSLDYITNLQQENEFLKLNNPEMNIEHFRIVKENKRKIDNLRKENKELKAIAEEHKNCTRKHWQEKCGEHHAKELIYKSRCEKANKFIKQTPLFEDPFGEGEHAFLEDINTEYYKNLSNVLNGSDEK